MQEQIAALLKLLQKELGFMDEVKDVLDKIPELLMSRRIKDYEFQEFLEKYEMESCAIYSEKQHLLQEISKSLHITKDKVNFKLLNSLGHPECHELGIRVNKTSQTVTLALLRASVFLNHFSKLNHSFQKLHQFFLQPDYSPRLLKQPVAPTLNFSREA